MSATLHTWEFSTEKIWSSPKSSPTPLLPTGSQRLRKPRGQPHSHRCWAGLSLTKRTARKIDPEIEVLELDVTVPDHVEAVRNTVSERWGRVDGVLHAIGFAPAYLGDDFFGAPWEDVATAMHISTYSLKTLADAFVPLMSDGGSIVGLDFDNSQHGLHTTGWVWRNLPCRVSRATWRKNLAKQHSLQSCRCGPGADNGGEINPGFALFEDTWDGRAPLGWDVNDPLPVAKACVALLSDWFPATTGEIIHVDGGYHAVGA